MQKWITVQVSKKSVEAFDVCSFELVNPNGELLPAFTAGAHIDVLVRPGVTRQYSLCNSASERHRYLIAVLREPQSRGGSIAMHDDIQEGMRIQISTPRNLFPLEANSSGAVLFAGGIGITPILCMADTLFLHSTPFVLHYCARSPDRMAFRERIAQAPYRDRVVMHFDDRPSAQRLDIGTALADSKPNTHLYVCGPGGFIQYVLDGAAGLGWDASRLHREYFMPERRADTTQGAFDVELSGNGAVYRVPADKTVVEVLAEHGVEIPVSCEQGVCGTCLTRIIAGEPEHRDSFLTSQERQRNDQFTPCCSRAKSARLVLDL